ncbi:MAG: 30S ribosomal protein S8 [Gammaproteobacteria bacterium]|nr:30S ribosomal protein S8 [Gammaproteobacteria bacterium]MDH3766996.1 30S ribosomal protein S8 [Gammaproteobacteria bacterium]
MSMTDPIADMLTRIRNGQKAGKVEVSMPATRIKGAIAKVLRDEGYVDDFQTANEDGKPVLSIRLRYHEGKPVIAELRRVSRPGLRIYRGKGALPQVMGGLGVAIVSTSQGVMSDRQARADGQGGEVLCVVS